jgi:hypothetical protein
MIIDVRKERFYLIRNIRSEYAALCINNPEEARRIRSEMETAEGESFTQLVLDGMMPETIELRKRPYSVLLRPKKKYEYYRCPYSNACNAKRHRVSRGRRTFRARSIIRHLMKVHNLSKTEAYQVMGFRYTNMIKDGNECLENPE